jgi:cytochrome c oxidase assembly protein subunit 15
MFAKIFRIKNKHSIATKLMQQHQTFIRYTNFLIVVVFLVILAGSIVRNTQSGMGCPDWPTCFGKWIPPTNASELPVDFEKYLKQQDIDHSFNVFHTWVEYVNRLLGALLGIFILFHVFFSYKIFRKTQSIIVLLSFSLLILVGFQGWLGKKVVDANLAVVKITLHLLVALLIAAIPVLINQLVIAKEKVENSSLKLMANFALAILTIQIIFGTRVREEIDVISKSLNYSNRELWIERLDVWFLVHRSFSLIVAILIVLIFKKCYANILLKKPAIILMLLLLTMIFLGTCMSLFQIPVITQPLHLIISSIFILYLFHFRLLFK